MTDWQEHEPIYHQLAQLVIEQIIRGSLAEGSPVPSVRQVAASERINPLTVSRAYRFFGTADPEFDDGTDKVDAEYASHNIMLGVVAKF